MSDYPEELPYFLEMVDYVNSKTDAAWRATLEEAVAYYNKQEKTNFIENVAVHAYLRWKDKQNFSLRPPKRKFKITLKLGDIAKGRPYNLR